ncbi:MAG: thermonuclease family protein, partial [Crocosphaera sp.]
LIANFPTCTVKPGSVYDGDTLRVLCNGQESKIRFACIDAPETKQPGGIEARDHLRSLLTNSGNQVKVKAITSDRYGRTVAELFFLRGNQWQLVQKYQAQEGMVWGYKKYKSDCPSWNGVYKAYTEAQQAKRGLWAGNPTPPWEWRRR